jgi:hypothetical protein
MKPNPANKKLIIPAVKPRSYKNSPGTLPGLLSVFDERRTVLVAQF